MKSTHFCRVLYVVLAGLFVCSSVVAASPPDNSITAVSSHEPSKSKADVSARGALTIYIDAEGKAILFDTGEKSTPPLPNIVELGLDSSIIEAVVFSHRETDHFHGLSDVLGATAMKLKVFVPAVAGEATSLQNPRATVVAVAKPTRVLPDAWLVGPIDIEFEGETTVAQALVLDRPDGLVVIVGCTNPAVSSIIEQVKEVFGHRRIKLIAGGIHLRATKRNDIKELSLRMQQLGIKGLALSKCTGEPALKVFREEWGDRMVSFDRGETIDF